MHTQDDVYESIRLPCPFSYQQEGLWLLELVQDVEVVCTCPRQNDIEKYDTSFKGTQAQDDLPPQDYKQKGKDKLQEEIDEVMASCF